MSISYGKKLIIKQWKSGTGFQPFSRTHNPPVSNILFIKTKPHFRQHSQQHRWADVHACSRVYVLMSCWCFTMSMFTGDSSYTSRLVERRCYNDSIAQGINSIMAFRAKCLNECCNMWACNSVSFGQGKLNKKNIHRGSLNIMKKKESFSYRL